MRSPRSYDRAIARLSRRELLKLAAWLGASAVAQPLPGTRVVAQPIFRDFPFSLGVASGDPLPDGVVLWTRLAPEPLTGGGMPNARIEVQWEVATDERFTDTVVQSGTAMARPELGHAVHVEVSGLAPQRDYFYRFTVGNETSHTGRTKTAPAAGAAVDQLRFAVCGCQHFEEGFFTAHRHIADQAFDFIVHTGDYIYEFRRGGGNLDKVRRHETIEPYTVADYRNRYAQYKSDPDLIAAHLSAPFVVMWDDHEVEDNYVSTFDSSDTPPEVFMLRRAAAYQAFYESMPLRRPAFPSGHGLQLYRRLRFGSLVDLNVLDTRQFRSNQACGDGVTPLCDEAKDPARTVLGAEQERWLFENLASQGARWTLLAEQVHTFRRDMSRATPAGFNMDKWDGYPEARARLYRRLQEARTPNPIVLSGDIHNHYAADLKMNFDDERSPAIAAELTNTSLSSNGDGSDLPAQWDRIAPLNPHIKYASNRRGYIACTATPQTLRAEFKLVEKVTVAGAPVTTGATLVVEAGRPGLQS